jgi:hypothetical protein
MIEFEVKAEWAEGWHRGQAATIEYGVDNTIYRYHVTCRSRYKLKSGKIRMKFESDMPIMPLSGTDPSKTDDVLIAHILTAPRTAF